MKKIVMVMMLIGLVATSYGTIQVGWTAGAGFYWDGSLEAMLSPGGSTIAQLMYSSDNVRDDINLTKAGTVNDTILSTYNITDGINSSVYGDFGAGLFEGTFASGYVYALIFQDSNVQVNDWYFYTPLLALEDVPVGGITQDIQMNTDLVNGDAINAGPTVAQVVPEPATVLLLGVGGVMSLILRRMRTA